MPPSPRPHLAGLEPAVHGSISAGEAAEHGFRPDAVLDFSVSTNPLGAPPGVLAALRSLDPARYPDDTAAELRQALAERNDVPAGWVLPGNGSSEIIWLAAQAYLGPGDRALIAGPAYGEYARAVQQAGAEAAAWRAQPVDDFALHPAALIATARQVAARLLFLGNPNNPTGYLTPDADLLALADNLPDTLVVIDEAYRPFVPGTGQTAELASRPNVLLIRSLTKDFGLAGLRLGYGLARPEVLRPLAALRPPWSVSSAAQTAGLAALADTRHVDLARAAIASAKPVLVAGLQALGFAVVPGAANFILVRTGDGAATRRALLPHGICVRDCASFGLPEYIRLGVRPVPECRLLLDALGTHAPVATR